MLINEKDLDHVLICHFDHTIGDGLSIGKLFTGLITKADGSKMNSLIPKSMISNKQNVDKKRFEMLLKLPKAIFDVFTAPLGKYDDNTLFSKNVTGKDIVEKEEKIVLFFDPVPMSFIKDLKNKAGVSINDILLTLWSHTIHSFCDYHDCPVMTKLTEKVLCRALLTLAFPNSNFDKADALRNKWVPLSFDLKIGEKDIMKRLQHIHKQSTSLKNSPLGYVQYFLQNQVLKYVPIELNRQTVYDVFSRHSMSWSNVPGPQEEICIASKPVKSCYYFVPTLIPVISMLSYNGQIHITFVAAESGIQNVDLMPTFYMKSLVTLGNELNVDIPSSIMKLANQI